MLPQLPDTVVNVKRYVPCRVEGSHVRGLLVVEVGAVEALEQPASASATYAVATAQARIVPLATPHVAWWSMRDGP
jgi:hypothetical protein